MSIYANILVHPCFGFFDDGSPSGGPSGDRFGPDGAAADADKSISAFPWEVSMYQLSLEYASVYFLSDFFRSRRLLDHIVLHRALSVLDVEDMKIILYLILQFLLCFIQEVR
jgi:hypothetical protein